MFTISEAEQVVDKYSNRYHAKPDGDCMISTVPGMSYAYPHNALRCKVNIKKDGKWTTTTYARLIALVNGKITEEQFNNPDVQVCHSCDRVNCINPEHLSPGDNLSNQLDSITKGRHTGTSKTECVNGHEFSPENTYIHQGRRRCKICRKAAEIRHKSKTIR